MPLYYDTEWCNRRSAVRRRRVRLGALGVWGALLWAGWLPGLALADTAAAPPGFTVLALAAGRAQVLDGDTFAADLDGDGRITEPRERVRLLYVDTPELGESRKGQDPAHGLPALAFLRERLAGAPLTLWVPAAEPTGNYGRTLAVVLVGGAPVNLALVRAGHSYFDTRFTFPPDPAGYAAYAEAEAEAFTARRGIWGEPDSRRRYLKRLKDELKTPAAADNPHYLPGLHAVDGWQPAGALGRYVHLEGRVATVRALRKGVRRLELQRGPGVTFPVVAFRRTAERLAVDAWPPGRRVRVEGFVKTWQGRPELVLHYGFVLP